MLWTCRRWQFACTYKKEGHPNSYNNPEMQKILRPFFELVKELGGTISGEHGIGLVQKNYLDIVFHEANLRLMREIKKLLILTIF